MPNPCLLHPEPLWQATANPYLQGDTQTQFWLSLWGLGVHFVPFPGLRSSGNQVLGEHCSRWAMFLNHLPGPGHLVSWLCRKSTVSDVLSVSSEELISG